MSDILNAIGVPTASVAVIILMTLIQISPLKINPWSWLAKQIGKGINGEVIKRIDDLDKRVDGLDKKITDQGEKEDERAAVNHRVRILRFGDELLEGRKHTKDSYDQVLTDITDYNQYCDDHPKFRNNQTMATVKYIEDSYQERLKKHDFL